MLCAIGEISYFTLADIAKIAEKDIHRTKDEILYFGFLCVLCALGEISFFTLAEIAKIAEKDIPMTKDESR